MWGDTRPGLLCITPRQDTHTGSEKTPDSRHRGKSWDWVMFYLSSPTPLCDPTTRRSGGKCIQKMYCQQTSCSYCLRCDRFLWHFADIDTSHIIVTQWRCRLKDEHKTRTFQFLKRYGSDYHIMWWWVSNWYSGWGSKFTIMFLCYILLAHMNS